MGDWTDDFTTLELADDLKIPFGVVPPVFKFPTLPVILPSLWTPAEIPGLAAWYGIDSVVYNVNSKVTTWNDKSVSSGNRGGTARNLTQTTPANRPLYYPDGFPLDNGPRVFFDSTGPNFLNFSTSELSPAVTLSVFALVEQNNVNLKKIIVGGNNTGSSGVYISSNPPASVITNQYTTLYATTPSGSVPLGVHLIESTNQSTPAFSMSGVDGNVVTAASGGGGSLQYLGYFPDDRFDGAMREIIIVLGPVSQETRFAIEGYFASKIGIVLPTTHPYKLAAPISGTVPARTLWNPSDKGSNAITFTNSSLGVYTDTAAADTITRSTTRRKSGKYSFRATGSGSRVVGVANINAPSTNFMGQTLDSAGITINTNGGLFTQINGASANLGTVPIGSPIDVLVNIDLRKMWFIVNGTNYFNGGDPALGTGGWVCPPGDIFCATDVTPVANSTIILDPATSRYVGFPAWGDDGPAVATIFTTDVGGGTVSADGKIFTTTGQHGARGVTSHDTGVYGFVVNALTIITANSLSVGLATAAASLTGTNTATNGTYGWTSAGYFYKNGSNVGGDGITPNQQYTTTDDLGIVYDGTQIFFYKNGILVYTMIGVSGPLFPWVSANASGYVFQMSTAAPPGGALPWNGFTKDVVKAATWSTTDKGSNVTVNYGNRRATSTSAGGIARATNSAGPGNRHFELKLIAAAGTTGAGLYPTTVPLDGSGSATSANILYVNNGNIFINGTSTAKATYTIGDVIGIDYNKDTGNYAVSKNGVIQLSGTIAAGLTTFPGCGIATAATWEINAGQDTFVSNPNTVDAWGMYVPPGWSTTDKAATWTVGSDPTVTTKTGTATSSTNRSTALQNSGYKYFEVKYTGDTSARVGVSNASAPTTEAFGSSTNGIAFLPNGLIVYNSGVVANTSVSIAIGDTLSVAVNFTAKTIDWYKNGTFIVTTPSSSFPSGDLFPAYGDLNGGSTGGILTINLGGTTSTYGPKSGQTFWIA